MNPLHCQRCKKAQATVHLTDIDGAEKRERHLCDECAAEEGIKIQVHQHVPLNELLTTFVLQHANVQQLAQMSCPKCGMTFAEFRNSGLLGCPHDYDAFEKALLRLLERAHDGGTRHTGKSPRRGRSDDGMTRAREVARLRRELEHAVETEDFERAARVRDSLKGLGAA
ncbi:MAG: UvrB/UvrC motif-containing protein [Phycisphaerae bacterium]|nr:UvrB/UvrC motif-containing protein [Phycisphaerae bacterium]NUQ46597.1 UvrB/UvrC motif-containing protein [Phycisphaerae bacterium]